MFLKKKINKLSIQPKLYPPCKKTILFTNARNEKNIKEWAAHHLLLGFDRIIIFDHMSTIPLTTVFNRFDKRVITIPCKLTNPVKIPLMNIAKNIGVKSNADWILYLDADEFLILNKYSNVKQLLNQFPFAQSISINWLMFGTNYLKKEPNGLILNNYTKSELLLDQHVKTFVRPNCITTATNPHYYNIIQKNRMYNINKQPMNHAIPYNFFRNPIPHSETDAYIAHYIYQAEETYIKRKINLPKDDTGHMRGNMDPNIHNIYNNIDNYEPKNKYAHQVETFLKLFE
jgi:hypothetical protein